ncbi:MAG: serine/threonine protein kinase, partial [Pirellulales bacterium]
EVRDLLAAHEEAPTGFLESPAIEGDFDATIAADGSGKTSGKPTGSIKSKPPSPVTLTEEEGDEVGPYKLLQQIGEGGFGTVWMAEQSEPISRKVALKVIKAGMDTKEVLARFEVERQAVALMDHPNIAKVLDAGATPSGRPWFAMELVKGIPITQFCDEQKLGTRARLALFGDVCSAINHAHQKGVIHRDIKPNNVMITLHGDKPVVKVIDFGIAKATQSKLTDKTLFTRFEQLIGTPVYMSPEQASLSGLDIDTRSDVYALGVLLYELLTGKPPFDGKSLISAGYEEMRRIIREDEPPKPSSRVSTIAGEERTTLAKAQGIEPARLHRLVEADLDWIVMKALEKDRTRRYETANAFAADIGRFLADEAVLATPPSVSYRLRKFTKRNRRTLISSALAGLALLAGLGVAGGVWLDSTLDKRQRVAAVEEQASTLIEEAERQMELNAQAPLEDDANFLQAQQLARRLESLGGVEETSVGLQSNLEKLLAAVDSEARDRGLIASLEEALAKKFWLTYALEPAQTLADASGTAFAAVGMNPLEEPVEEMVAAILKRRQSLRDPIIGGLVAWRGELKESEPENARLREIIAGCDSDPWRQSLRKMIADGDGAALEALAESPDLPDQPVWAILQLAEALQDQQVADASVKLLRRAQWESPEDYWANFRLGWELASSIGQPKDRDLSDKLIETDIYTGLHDPGTALASKAPVVSMESEEAIGFLRAAVVARPESYSGWLILGW